MGYTRWEQFTSVLDRARNTGENLEMDLTSHFQVNLKTQERRADVQGGTTDCPGSPPTWWP